MRRQALRMVVVVLVSVVGCVSAYAGPEDARTWEEDFESDPRLNTDDWQARGGGPSQAQFALENGMAVWDGSVGWDLVDSVDHFFNGVTTIQMDFGAHPGDGSFDDRGVGWFLLAGNSSDTSGTTGMLLASWALAMDGDGPHLMPGGDIDGGHDPIYVAEGPVSTTVKMTVLPEDEGGEVEYSICDSECAAGGAPITGSYLQLNRGDFSEGEKGFTFTSFGDGMGAIDYLKVVNDPNPIGTGLQAGDADQDLDFDQFDLIMVQVAAKYMSGEAATWGEGDWDAAPGGAQGSPPPGNGLFDQLDIIAALSNNLYLTGPYGAIGGGGGALNDAQTSVVYDVSTGEVSVDAPAGLQMTSINIDSAAGVFTGEPAANLGGSFDNDGDDNIFKATFGSSFGSLSFGNVAQAGLSQEFLLNDLTVVGSLDGGGDLGDVDLVYVPEPGTMLLLLGGIVTLVSTTRRRRLS